MKHFKILLFAAAFFIISASSITAQSKVAHINTQDLLQSMPEMISAKAELEKLAKSYDADLKALATEYQNKVKKYDAEAATKTDAENADRFKEVQEDEKTIREYSANAQKDIAEKEATLVKPIYEKAKAAVLKVAKTQGYEYVFDSQPGSGMIMYDGKDLLLDVKKELGI